MSKIDDLIEQGLSAEDSELLARHGEPGYFTQAWGLFRGSLGWVVWLAYLTGIAAFIGFGYTLWQAWIAVDAIWAVRWGVLAMVLFQYVAMVKVFMGSHMEANRMLRELKRVELELSLLRRASVDTR